MKSMRFLLMGIVAIVLVGVGFFAFTTVHNAQVADEIYEELSSLITEEKNDVDEVELTQEERQLLDTYQTKLETVHTNGKLKDVKAVKEEILQLKQTIDTRKKGVRFTNYMTEVDELVLEEEPSDFVQKKEALIQAIEAEDDEAKIKELIIELRTLYQTYNEQFDQEAEKQADDTINSGGTCHDLTGRARGECFRRYNQDTYGNGQNNNGNGSGNPCIGLRGRERGVCNRDYYGR